MNYTEKIDKTPTCHIWTGALNSYGYGVHWIDGKVKKAHRLVYEGEVGPIPEGLVINHLCRVRNCVNVQHLEVTTHRHNILTGNAGSAVNARKTHCNKGHEFNMDNTYTRPNGWRICRICKNKWHRDRTKRIRMERLKLQS